MQIAKSGADTASGKDGDLIAVRSRDQSPASFVDPVAQRGYNQ